MSDRVEVKAGQDETAVEAGAARPRRSITGSVVSSSRDKTIAVLVERRVKHPLYGKVARRSRKIHAHDQDNQCAVGDWVKIEQSRPISKTKSWRLVEVLEKAAGTP